MLLVISYKKTGGLIIRYFLIILTVICLVFSAGAIQAQEFGHETEKMVLDNGATIVARYVPESSLVTIQIRVMSGLSNEGVYAGSGISHFIEHLLFKGTKNKTAEDIRREIKSMGGVVNASTGLDSAEYHITVPNENFEEALKLLARVVRSLFSLTKK
ncbi:MAG: insulinase family protein [Candidatus Omnitrophica bacterium]|nr:insulinase family protein [Candidatus Omnitrophota bacterium]